MRYPAGLNKSFKGTIHYDNRGMNLEADLNATNEYYRNMDIGLIYKKPTPITIVKVDYPSRYEAVIKEAYFRTKDFYTIMEFEKYEYNESIHNEKWAI